MGAKQIIAVLGKKSFLNDGGYLVVERSAHDDAEVAD